MITRLWLQLFKYIITNIAFKKEWKKLARIFKSFFLEKQLRGWLFVDYTLIFSFLFSKNHFLSNQDF